MNKLKIAGIIISIVAAVAFVFLYFRKPHTCWCNLGTDRRSSCCFWNDDGGGKRRIESGGYQR